MRTLLALALLSLVARAGVVDVPPPVPQPWVNRANIQAAVDQAGNSGNWLGEPGLVRFPAGTWTIDGPVFVDHLMGPFATVSFRGVDRDLSIVKMQDFVGRDALVIGMARQPRNGNGPGLVMDTAYLPPSPLGIPGRTGFRTRGRTHLAQYGGHLDQGPGDWYAKTRKLTVEYPIRFEDAAAVNGGIVSAIADGISTPLAIRQVNSRVYVTLATSGPDASDPESQTVRNFMIDVDKPLSAGILYKVTLQVDLDTKEVLKAWIKDSAATVRMDGPPMKLGESFYANQHAPWVVGGAAFAGGTPPGDFTIGGWKVTADALYDPAATALTRKDGRPIDDGRYFRVEDRWFALVPFDSPADAVARDRVVTVRGRDVGGNVIESCAYVTEPEHADPFAMTHAGEVRDLGIVKGDGWYGNGIALGMVTDARVRDCKVSGGARGIGSLGMLCYPLDLADLTLAGHAEPLFLAWTSAATARNLYFPESYRCGVRVIYGGISIRKVMSGHSGSPDYGFCVRYGTIQLEQIGLDNENPSGGSVIADVYVTPGIAGQPSSANVVIEDMDPVYSGPRSSKILLGGPAKNSPLRSQVGACSVRVSGFAVHSGVPFDSVVRCLAQDLWQDQGIKLLGRFDPPAFRGFPLMKGDSMDTGGGAPNPMPTPRVAARKPGPVGVKAIYRAHLARPLD